MCVPCARALVYTQSTTEAKHKWLEPNGYNDTKWFKSGNRKIGMRMSMRGGVCSVGASRRSPSDSCVSTSL